MNDQRKALWDALMGGYDRDKIGFKEFEAAMDVYDHELAEQIRAEAGSGVLNCTACSHAAADLIDPEA